MSTRTHYATLGLLPNTPPEVIRASYKALALIYHPDKTMQLTASERASHAAIFKDVQAAYDVLGNSSLKATYDAELARQSNSADHSTPPRATSRAATTPQRKHSVKLTTPLEKAAARARARQSIEYLRVKRAERNVSDTLLDVAELKAIVEIWSDLAEENESDPAMHAYCTIRIFEYNQKIVEREEQHQEWLAKLSSAKRVSPTTASSSRASTSSSRYSPSASTSSSHTSRARATHATTPEVSPTPASRTAARAEERKRAEAERAAAAAAREQARALEKAQREAAKQAHLERKIAAVRAEKEKLQRQAELQAQKDSERIAKARAKASTASSASVGASVRARSPITTKAIPSAIVEDAYDKAETGRSRICSKCGDAHASFREWLKCNKPAASADAP